MPEMGALKARKSIEAGTIVAFYRLLPADIDDATAKELWTKLKQNEGEKYTQLLLQFDIKIKTLKREDWDKNFQKYKQIIHKISKLYEPYKVDGFLPDLSYSANRYGKLLYGLEDVTFYRNNKTAYTARYPPLNGIFANEPFPGSTTYFRNTIEHLEEYAALLKDPRTEPQGKHGIELYFKNVIDQLEKDKTDAIKGLQANEANCEAIYPVELIKQEEINGDDFGMAAALGRPLLYLRSTKHIEEGEPITWCYGSKYTRDYETSCPKAEAASEGIDEPVIPENKMDAILILTLLDVTGRLAFLFETNTIVAPSMLLKYHENTSKEVDALTTPYKVMYTTTQLNVRV